MPVDEYRMAIRTIGGGGIDTPGGTWPDLHMKWMPIYNESCTNCKGDASTNHIPYCVYNCTTESLVYGDLEDEKSAISRRLDELKSKEYRIYELPQWEGTKNNVIYAERGI